MAFAILGNSPLQKRGIPLCNFEEFYLAENTSRKEDLYELHGNDHTGTEDVLGKLSRR
jgi:hypothetical protein